MEHLKPFTKLYKAVHESYNDALTAFLSRNITVAMSVRNRKAEVVEAHHQTDSVCNALPMDVAQNIISTTSLINQIYDYSVDISDLTTPKGS